MSIQHEITNIYYSRRLNVSSAQTALRYIYDAITFIPLAFHIYLMGSSSSRLTYLHVVIRPCGVLAKTFTNKARLNTCSTLLVVLYGTETWTSTKIKEQGLRTSNMKFLVRISELVDVRKRTG